MFMTTVCAHTCRTSILTLYQQPSCFMFIIANDLSNNHDRKRPAIFLRRRASRREAPTASQWTIRPFRPALHSSLFIHSVPGHLESSRKIQPVPARFVFLLIFPLLFPPILSASFSCYLPHSMLKCCR